MAEQRKPYEANSIEPSFYTLYDSNGDLVDDQTTEYTGTIDQQSYVDFDEISHRFK